MDLGRQTKHLPSCDHSTNQLSGIIQQMHLNSIPSTTSSIQISGHPQSMETESFQDTRIIRQQDKALTTLYLTALYLQIQDLRDYTLRQQYFVSQLCYYAVRAYYTTKCHV